MKIKNPKTEYFSPQVKLIRIATETIFTASSVQENASHEDYESIDLFE